MLVVLIAVVVLLPPRPPRWVELERCLCVCVYPSTFILISIFRCIISHEFAMIAPFQIQYLKIHLILSLYLPSLSLKNLVPLVPNTLIYSVNL